MIRLPGQTPRRWIRAGIDLLFAPQCAWCGETWLDQPMPPPDLLLCSACQSRLVPSRLATCRRCGAVTPPHHAADDCARCRDRRYAFQHVLSLGTYEGELRQAVLRLKRPGQEPLARALAELVWQANRHRLSEMPIDVVAAVPMHWRRRLIRGVNSPDLIAEHLASRLRRPLAVGLARRRRYTAAQADVPVAARFRNLRGAFRARRRYYLGAARVLLVDDILTTGATCSEIAKVLRTAGAEQVTALVLARAEGSV